MFAWDESLEADAGDNRKRRDDPDGGEEGVSIANKDELQSIRQKFTGCTDCHQVI